MEYKLLNEEQKNAVFAMLRASKLDPASVNGRHFLLRYGDAKRQKMNLWLPRAEQDSYPVIVFLHGGGWESGSPDDTQVKPFLPGLEKGYAVISCGYRLMPDVFYPDNLYDVKAALRWLLSHGADYQLDMNRLVLAGSSAGAYLALMTAYTQGQAAFEGGNGPAPSIRCVIDQFGPTDFAKENEHFEQTGCPRMFPPAPAGKATPDRLLQSDTSRNPSLLRFIAPIHQVHKDIPPTLILHGRYDPMVSYRQSETLYEAIREACGKDHSRLIISEETTHADTAYEQEPYTSAIFDFISQHV